MLKRKSLFFLNLSTPVILARTLICASSELKVVKIN